MKDAQDPPPPDSQPPPLDAVSATPPPPAAGDPMFVTAVPLPEGMGGIKADLRPLGSGEKRSISMALKGDFVNPEEVGYVHKFRWGTKLRLCAWGHAVRVCWEDWEDWEDWEGGWAGTRV